MFGDATALGSASSTTHTRDRHRGGAVAHATQAVPKERVRPDKDVVTDEEQVSETLQKEQIETEGVTPRR